MRLIIPNGYGKPLLLCISHIRNMLIILSHQKKTTKASQNKEVTIMTVKEFLKEYYKAFAVK